MSSTNANKVIWVIDDDDVEALLIREALIHSVPGATVRTMRDADVAHSALADTSVPRPQLVVLDYFLPGCEAPDLLPTLRDSLGWTPIVVLSGLAQKVDIRRCFEAQASLFIEKPHSYTDLSSALARVTDVYLNVALFPDSNAR